MSFVSSCLLLIFDAKIVGRWLRLSKVSPKTGGSLRTETLDIEQPAALTTYLRQEGYLAADQAAEFRLLKGGVSNRAVWVKLPSGEQWVIKQALEKLRVPVDWFSDPVRIHREALGLRWLSRLGPVGTIPRLIFEDEARHVLAMEAAPLPHANWKQLLLAGEVDLEYVAQFGRLLGTIHAGAYQRRVELAPVFTDRSFFESLRLEPYYRYTAERMLSAQPFLHRLIQDTLSRPITLVHGDYSPKNILIHDGRLILLDHEVIHWGDPAFDLGFSLTHLLSKAHHLPAQRQALRQTAHHYWRVYQETINRPGWATDLEGYALRHTLACLLARVAGRSTLEYLSSEARTRQQQVTVTLMKQPPPTLADLIEQFVTKVQHEDDR